MELLTTKHAASVLIYSAIVTTWKDKWTTWKDRRQSGETFDVRDRMPRINGFAPQIRETLATKGKDKEKGSQDPRERREDKGSRDLDNMDNGLETETENGNGYGTENEYGTHKLENTDNGLETEMENGNGNRKKYECCGKVFGSYRGLRIHQGRKCQKKGDAQQRRSTDRQTVGRVPQESNHSGNDPTLEQSNATEAIGDRKPKIKWPKANEVAEYKKFDEDVNRKLMKMKGSTEQKLEKLAGTIYEEGLKRYGLEKERKEKSQKHPKRTSRRQEKIKEVRKEKKRLRTMWLRADDDEKEGLQVLYEETKKKHRQLMRDERRAERRKERKKCRKEFVKDPYKFAKKLFDEKKGGKLECTKEELEEHLKKTYTDAERNKKLPPMEGIKRPTAPGKKFNMNDLKMKEVEMFVKKARAKAAPGNDGVCYKVYKYCSKLRIRLFLLLKEMWKRKDVAQRWAIAEGIYLPKEEESKEIGQFRPVSLLNIDGKIMFGVVAKRIITFVTENGFVDESNQKAGIPGIPGCVEHAFSIWDAIQDAKKYKKDLSVVWLDLANAYGSVPHVLIEQAMEFFWIPEPVRAMVRMYYDKFKMRYTTGSFTTEWQRLEVGIAAGCTISVILFVLVMEMILKACKCDGAEVTTPLRSFMDDITALVRGESVTRKMLERLDKLIAWSRMKFKAKKSRSLTFRKGVQKEARFFIGGEPIPTVKEKPVKSLGRLYQKALSDREQGREVQKTVEDGLEAIDKTSLPGNFKCWCLQFVLYPRVLWPMMMYDLAISRIERIEQKCNNYIRKWLGLPKMLTTAALYGKTIPLRLPLASIAEEFKAGKVRTVMTLRYSKDVRIRENPPEVRSGKKWIVEQTVNKIIEQLEHKDIVGAVQTNREGLGLQKFKPFCASSAVEKRKAVVSEMRMNEEEERKVKLVQCSVQGQCLRWESVTIERKIGWKDIWDWETARTSFLIRSTYDVLPSPANLKRWKQDQNENCKCGQKGTMKHILSHCPLGLHRRTWRHNQVLKVIQDWFKKKIGDINKGNPPKMEKLVKISFVKEGRAATTKNKKTNRNDARWEGKWKVEADLETSLVFPLVTTTQRPDLVVWNEDSKKAIVMELTVSWEENIGAAEDRKAERYKNLIEKCEDEGWETEYHHIGIGARGFIDKGFHHLVRNRCGFTQSEASKMMKEIQQTVEKASMWLWLKRDDPSWSPTSN